MKAITLWQPWASLVAIGAKTIETRSWATKYRGPLAIHAAARLTAIGYRTGAYTVVSDADLAAIPDNRFLVRWPEAQSLDPTEPWRYLHTGAVVATCTLVDVVPMQSFAQHDHDGPHLLVEPGYDLALWTPEARTIVEAQRPYGDFAPGRYAWLLEDVQALPEPVPARGRQQLWDWPAGDSLVTPT